MQRPGAGQANSFAVRRHRPAPPPGPPQRKLDWEAGWGRGPVPHFDRLRSPGVSPLLITMADHGRAGVRAHACFGQWQRRRTESAFGRHSSDQPMGAAATGAMIDLMLAIHCVITTTSGIVRHAQVAECRDSRHKIFLSDHLNGSIGKRLHRLRFRATLKPSQSLRGTGVQSGLRGDKCRSHRKRDRPGRD